MLPISKESTYFTKLNNLEQLLDAVSTPKTSEKVNALVHFFEGSSDEDNIWLIALFTGRRPKRTVKLNLLREWAAEYAGVPDWLFEESYAVVGDLAETIALLIPEEGADNPESLASWMNELKKVKDWELEEQKAWIYSSWKSLNRVQRFIFNKLLTGGFRIGVSDALIVQALHRYTGIEKDELSFRLSGKWDPYEVSFDALIRNPGTELSLSKPYPFFLAYALEDQQEWKDVDFGQWQFEYKWDGIRGQLIKRENTISLWSRGEEIISESFPDIIESVTEMDFQGAMDGEILCWDFEQQQPRPFADLQKRLGRKSPGKKTLTEYPAFFLAYDLMEMDGKDLRAEPLVKRRELLDNLCNHEDFHSSDRLGISQVLPVSNLNEAIEFRGKSKEVRSEGLMIKKKDSSYGVGRKRGDWWKWKIEPETIDAVMIYAQKGHGRRASRYTDFTFALYKGEELVPFCKAYSGLSNEEINKVNLWIKDHIRERFGPVASVDAELVFEIAFEGINRSNRHKSGVAVRFPRIIRWRKDKPLSEIGRVEDLLDGL